MKGFMLKYDHMTGVKRVLISVKAWFWGSFGLLCGQITILKRIHYYPQCEPHKGPKSEPAYLSQELRQRVPTKTSLKVLKSSLRTYQKQRFDFPSKNFGIPSSVKDYLFLKLDNFIFLLKGGTNLILLPESSMILNIN